MNGRVFCLLIPGILLGSQTRAQHPPGQQSSANMRYVAHIPLAGTGDVNDIEIEQELSRPYVYLSGRAAVGFHIIEVRDIHRPMKLWRWQIETADLHPGRALENKYFKLENRYYTAQSFSFRAGGPNADLGAVVFDVTGLPDTTTIREVARIRAPDTLGGFHNIFAYKHSDGGVYLFATTASQITDAHGANVYDMSLLLSGAPNHGLVSRVPLPRPRGARRGYHDAYVAYHPVSGQDRFYGGGPESTYEGGQYVVDVSNIRDPRVIATILAVPSQQSGGHTFVVTPDGRYGITEMTSLGHTPLRFFDLEPALATGRPTVLQPLSEWTADWIKSSHNMEIRWPYVFVSAYEDGVQVIDMRDPTKPHTVAFYDTFDYVTPYSVGGEAAGVFGVDVRNADGLIVAGDMQSGFWAFKMEGFDGWNGHDWGMPNISSAQDWDAGPEAPVRARGVSMR